MVTITLAGKEYNLASNLRVAYELQGCNGHASYVKILSEMGDATLEKQIEILYVAFKVANPDAAKELNQLAFTSLVLDDPNMSVSTLIEAVKQVVTGIMGKDMTSGDEGNA